MVVDSQHKQQLPLFCCCCCSFLFFPPPDRNSQPGTPPFQQSQAIKKQSVHPPSLEFIPPLIPIQVQPYPFHAPSISQSATHSIILPMPTSPWHFIISVVVVIPSSLIPSYHKIILIIHHPSSSSHDLFFSGMGPVRSRSPTR
ncbi:hypothetical protein VTJ04DRAFT_3229 [Mycothermus thermophilus]|uniref:uncharacterized protein n=1 Tax=Humicola insolens TaxID=85995 RepID=UPI003743B42D